MADAALNDVGVAGINPEIHNVLMARTITVIVANARVDRTIATETATTITLATG